ncbi:MAG: response regulator [Nitrospiraceae bacterium]|nr:response regulator [Nitrospiraceae bacterium]
MSKKGSILVIDDEEIVRISCMRILGPAGYDIETASDGTSALSMLGGDKKYDLVLTDLKMPNMDGLEVMAEIKKRLPGAKVIIVTGYSTLETAVKAIKMGAFNYIEKPFTPESLLTAIKEALEEGKAS